MFDNLLLVITLAATVGCGLLGGVFFAFSTFVLKALARLPPNEGITAMQSINVVAVKSGFLAAFLGTTVACFMLTIAACIRRQAPGSMFMLFGGTLYVIGSFLVTALFNVPLNNRLAAIVPDSPDGTHEWASYLRAWAFWNHVRTGATLTAMAALIFALTRAAETSR